MHIGETYFGFSVLRPILNNFFERKLMWFSENRTIELNKAILNGNFFFCLIKYLGQHEYKKELCLQLF